MCTPILISSINIRGLGDNVRVVHLGRNWSISHISLCGRANLERSLMQQPSGDDSISTIVIEWKESRRTWKLDSRPELIV